MNITEKQIRALKPCEEGLAWYLRHKERDLLTLLLTLSESHHDWARWLFWKLMTHKQCVKIAIFSAEQVLHVYEDEYPKDNRPRRAIEAAKKWVTSANATSAARTAARAARIAARTAARAARAAHATHAAYAATSAAGAAASAAGSAAYAAANVIHVAYDADAARAVDESEDVDLKIIREAVRLLEVEDDNN